MDLLLEITDLSRSGPGLGRDSTGRVVFVPFTAPGDKVRVEIVEEEKRYSEARLLELIEPSPRRALPPCPAFGRCGGCEWQHLPYDLQWQTKKSGIRHSLQRVGVEEFESLPWDDLPAEKIWEYRNRVQLRGFRDQIGFYERRSKSLVPIEKCWIARPELNARIPSALEAGSHRHREYKLELEVFPDGNVTEAWNSGHSARGFRQVHDEQNTRLQAWVAEHAGSGGTLLDLYGGSGNLSLGLADRFAQVHCVDVGAPAHAPLDTPANYFFHRAPVLQWLESHRKELESAPAPFHLILDPPREGLGTELGAILGILRSLPVRETLLIGCEPDPWARAVHRLQKLGWKMERLGALDFFPQTHHIEALAALRKV
jgi:23S rRNA (uracil1939-C5)-methyltransferase